MKKITLEAWAARRYDPAPSAYLLRKWRKAGELHPAPELVGRDWMIEPDARRVLGDEPARGGLLAQMGVV